MWKTVLLVICEILSGGYAAASLALDAANFLSDEQKWKTGLLISFVAFCVLIIVHILSLTAKVGEFQEAQPQIQASVGCHPGIGGYGLPYNLVDLRVENKGAPGTFKAQVIYINNDGGTTQDWVHWSNSEISITILKGHQELRPEMITIWRFSDRIRIDGPGLNSHRFIEDTRVVFDLIISTDPAAREEWHHRITVTESELQDSTKATLLAGKGLVF